MTDLLKQYLLPYWEGNTVYNETLMFVADKCGRVEEAPLLYDPDSIQSVLSFDLTKAFIEGKDFAKTDKGIRLLLGTEIPIWDYDRFYLEEPVEGKSFQRTDGGYLVFGEGDTFVKTQVAVTYRHSQQWSGLIPQADPGKLPNFRQKLKAGQEVTIVFYGDSITAGCNVSSNINISPYMPMWSELVSEELKSRYHNDKLHSFNTAVGGTSVTWGLANAKERVSRYTPDLAVIAFGMNDPEVSPEDYRITVKKLIDAVRLENPGTEFVLVSPMIPNRQLVWFGGNQPLFEQELLKIAAPDSGTVVAPVTSVCQALLSRKRFIDMTANNVNHPNDFMARAYAHTILSII